MAHPEVLIVGAGPTGTSLALELAVQKVSFRLVDKAPIPSDKSRALVVQPRTLELLNRHGDARGLVALGNPTGGPLVFINGRQIADVDIADVCTNSAFSRALLVTQHETERFLEACLAGRNGRAVERGVEAASVVQDADGVTATLRHLDGREEVVRARYVVGADGAHSVVRKASENLTFDGSSYPQDFILCDAHVRGWRLPWDRFLICLGWGLMAVFPLRDGVVRIIASRPGISDEADPTLEDFQKWLDQLLPGSGELHDPTWLTRFNLHHRVVNRYRDGRIFVAGDAAHIHSPAGGQGMNTGIQDSVNLGWKLARVLRGDRPDSFLDSYGAERRPVGQQLLSTTDRIFALASTPNAVKIFLRNLLLPRVLPWAVGRPAWRAEIFKFISELGVNYRRSPIVGPSPRGSGGPVVAAGDRAPDGRVRVGGVERYFLELLRPDTHHLVLFSGAGPEGKTEEEEKGGAVPACDDLEHAAGKFRDENPDAAEVHMVVRTSKGEEIAKPAYVDVDGRLHGEYGFAKPGYVYVRPDGYVAHIGPLSAVDELVGWLR